MRCVPALICWGLLLVVSNCMLVQRALGCGMLGQGALDQGALGRGTLLRWALINRQ